MTDATRMVCVSDLHLGSNPRLDDFLRDGEFARLVELPELQALEGGAIDLVLLGDTFDVWQSVADAECGTDPAQVPLQYDAGAEEGRIAAALAKHAAFADALRAFARRERTRIVMVTGNHDHSLVNAGVQASVREALRLDAGRLAFADAYENAAVGVYAEHGNQYDDNNAYDRFESFDWRQDAPGYYFVRLFFNRIEVRDPRLENSPEGWRGVWHWLKRVGDLPLLAYAIRCFWQYRRDPRVGRHVTFKAGAGPSPERLVRQPEAPELLVGAGDPRSAPGHFFSVDPETEGFLREAYRDSPEVKAAVDEVLADRARGGEVPPTGPVPGGRSETFAFGPPEDVGWAERLYAKAPALRSAPLDRKVHRSVLFGHTHRARVAAIGGGRNTYLNTGSWTEEKGPVPVVIAEPGKAARLLKFDGRRFTEG
jgi:UDP-2,3-diacylglucosamine pyrophosphatase LpxH